MKKALTYIVAALAVVSMCIVLFSLFGAAVFFLPMLGGVLTSK